MKCVVEDNCFLAGGIYNFGETGLAMGLLSAQKVVIRDESYGRSSILQQGNREWVAAIEVICPDGYPLPSCVIFALKVYIAGWLESNLPSHWRIEVSNSSWTTDGFCRDQSVYIVISLYVLYLRGMSDY